MTTTAPTAPTAFPAKAGNITCMVTDLPPLKEAVAKAFPSDLERDIALKVLTFCALNEGWKWVSVTWMRRWLAIELGEPKASQAEEIGRRMIAEGYLVCEIRDRRYKVFPTAKLIDKVRHAL